MILLVEDDRALRDVLREILEAAGHAVLDAATPHAALQVAAAFAGPIHLLITDLVLPGMNGQDLARQLAGLRPDLRVLYMSGYTDDTVVRYGLEEGAHFLQKPFTTDALLRAIGAAIHSPGLGE
jgi:DNA-binding response OmpR family regulator